MDGFDEDDPGLAAWYFAIATFSNRLSMSTNRSMSRGQNRKVTPAIGP